MFTRIEHNCHVTAVHSRARSSMVFPHREVEDHAHGDVRVAERRHVLEVIEDRYGRRTYARNQPASVEHWHELIGDTPLPLGVPEGVIESKPKGRVNLHGRDSQPSVTHFQRHLL